MPIYTGIQQRNSVIGTLRCGDQVASGNKTRPHALLKWRVTTHAQVTAAQIAALYGGQARPWEAKPGQWEVYTDCTELPVALPPGQLVITQWMERWTGGGCTMRCDGRRTTLPAAGPCQCPQPDDPGDDASVWAAIEERQRLAGLKPPQGCRPYTRLALCLADIGDVGVFNLTSKSEQAAAEVLMKARILEAHRAQGVFLPARIAIEPRESVVRGETRHYVVPVLRLDDSIRAIMTGEAAQRALDGQLPPLPGGEPRAAITGGAAPLPSGRPADPPQATAQELANAAAHATVPEQVQSILAVAADQRMTDDEIRVRADSDGEVTAVLGEYLTAQWRTLRAAQLAGQAAKATSRDAIKALAGQAKADKVTDEQVPDGPGADAHWVPLRDFINAAWASLAPAGDGG